MGPIERTLRKARHLIGLEENWMKGGYSNRDVTAFCSLGALDQAKSNGTGRETGNLGSIYLEHCWLERAMREIEPTYPLQMVHQYNDTHTHEEVLEMFDRAIKQAAEDGA